MNKLKKALVCFLKVIVFIILWIIFVSIIPIPELDNNILFMIFGEGIPFIITILLTLIFCYFEKNINIKMFNISLKKLFISILIGVVWIISSVIIIYLLGCIKLIQINKINYLLIWGILLFINTIMQELLVRGYIYQILKKNYNIVISTSITTIIFTMMHGGIFQSGIIPLMNVLTMSLLMTVIMEYSKSLIAPIIIHFIWNFIGGIILSGVLISDIYPHIFDLQFIGNKIVSGGEYRLEGSIIVLILNILLIALFTIFINKENKLKERRY